MKGRGATDNPKGRFERLAVERDAEWGEPPPDRVATELLVDSSRSVLSRNTSPDVPFEFSLNPYRGCEHGCAYCYARPTHEYLGFSAGLDFETKILVKERAPELLREALLSPRWRPQPVALSGVTDPYQPVERRLEITRRCLEVLRELRNPVEIITKNDLVTRDLDILSEMAAIGGAAVCLSVTTLDGELVRKMEPRTAHPRRRLEAVRRIASAGVPVAILIAPVVPALNDHEIPAILEAAAEAGAANAGFIMLRLPRAVAPLFESWLERQFPDRKERVLRHLRDMRGGRLNDPRFGSRMRGEGPVAEQIRQLFEVTRRRVGLEGRKVALTAEHFRRPGEQRALF